MTRRTSLRPLHAAIAGALAVACTDTTTGFAGPAPPTGGSAGIFAAGGVAPGAGGAGGAAGATAAGGTLPASGGVPVSGGAPASGGTAGLSGAGGSAGSAGIGGAGGSAGSAGMGGAGGGMAVTCPATSMLTPGETTQMLQLGSDPTQRSYLLHVPASYTGKTPVPLVLDFHDTMSNSALERGNSGYAALSDQEGFIVAYPQGIDNSWNVGPCCTTSRTVDDLGFAKAVVAKIESQGCIDPKRVYATGFSMGGGMSHHLACNAADVFATVAPSAFDLLTEDEEPCHPMRPISVISFRGTTDTAVPYAGGAVVPLLFPPVTIHLLGAVATFQKWAMLDGCTDTPSAADADGCQAYAQCNAGVEVTLCTTQSGGHVTGNAQLGWAAMKKHPMP